MQLKYVEFSTTGTQASGSSGNNGREKWKDQDQEHQVRVGTMAVKNGKTKIKNFDGSDFRFWKMQIENYLYSKDLYQLLMGQKTKSMFEAEVNVLDRKTLGVISLLLS